MSDFAPPPVPVVPAAAVADLLALLDADGTARLELPTEAAARSVTIPLAVAMKAAGRRVRIARAGQFVYLDLVASPARPLRVVR